jgi:glycosyltransferase involved in cell wall biosynthesis
VKDEQIDVVHAHSPMPAAMARPVLRAMPSRPALIYTEHNSWDCYGLPTRLANAGTYLLDDLHVAVSTEAVGSVPAALRGGLAPMVHGIDLEAVRSHRDQRDAVRSELGVTDDDVVLTVVANLRSEKAYDVLLPAVRKVLDDDPRALFLSVGQGPLADEMAELHRQLDLGDRFRFLGFRSDVPDLLAASDVFTLSSRHEGLPVSLMEAAALGLPTVATRVGGLGDVLTDGVDALVVPPEQPDVLATAYLRVVRDPELRATLSAGARFFDPQPEFTPRDPPVRFRKNVRDVWIELRLREGRNRQVRRMTAAVGHPTLRLVRVAIGRVSLGSLVCGSWRELSLREIQMLTAGS